MTNATSWAGERKWELCWEWVDWAQSWLQRSTSRVSEGEVKEHIKQEQVHPNHFICCHCWCCNLAKGFSLQWWRWLRVAGRGLRVQEKLVKRSWAVKKKGGGASGKLSPAKYTECQLIVTPLLFCWMFLWSVSQCYLPAEEQQKSQVSPSEHRPDGGTGLCLAHSLVA